MSYQLFKTEILAKLNKTHTSKTKTAGILATAYTNLILRHFEVLTGGGVFSMSSTKTQPLKMQIQSVFMQNYTSHNRVNLWSQLSPGIMTFWTGQICMGTTGIVAVTSPGTFMGPPIPESNNPAIWIDMFSYVSAIHLKTLVGTYTNYVTGITVPWSGTLLQTFP